MFNFLAMQYSWEETVVNLVNLDMLERNKAHTEFAFNDGFSTYSYPYIQEDNKELTKSLHGKFIESIDNNIVYKNYSDYFLINRALYTSLMGKQKVMLGKGRIGISHGSEVEKRIRCLSTDSEKVQARMAHSG